MTSHIDWNSCPHLPISNTLEPSTDKRRSFGYKEQVPHGRKGPRDSTSTFQPLCGRRIYVISSRHKRQTTSTQLTKQTTLNSPMKKKPTAQSISLGYGHQTPGQQQHKIKKMTRNLQSVFHSNYTWNYGSYSFTPRTEYSKAKNAMFAMQQKMHRGNRKSFWSKENKE